MCEECSDSFSSEHALNTHISMVHGKPEKICVTCGNSFKVQPCRVENAKYCSKECQYKSLEVDRLSTNCDNCNNHLERRKLEIDKRENIFCDVECRVEYFKGENHPRWDDGYYNLDLGDYGPKWEDYRESIISRDGVCQLCKNNPENKQVHHIIPVKEFSTIENAHQLDNLVLLCPSCHMTVEHNWSVDKQKEKFING